MTIVGSRSKYQGVCHICKKRIKTYLEICENNVIPPPEVKVGCSCERPPVSVSLVYIDSEARQD